MKHQSEILAQQHVAASELVHSGLGAAAELSVLLNLNFVGADESVRAESVLVEVAELAESVLVEAELSVLLTLLNLASSPSMCCCVVQTSRIETLRLRVKLKGNSLLLAFPYYSPLLGESFHCLPLVLCSPVAGALVVAARSLLVLVAFARHLTCESPSARKLTPP